jgi:hypothetical protein
MRIRPSSPARKICAARRSGVPGALASALDRTPGRGQVAAGPPLAQFLPLDQPAGEQRRLAPARPAAELVQSPDRDDGVLVRSEDVLSFFAAATNRVDFLPRERWASSAA